LAHEFFTEKAVENHFPSEPYWDYKDCTIKGGWKEDTYDLDGPARHFYNLDTGGADLLTPAESRDYNSKRVD
jgi:hypothetical protein